MRSEGGWGGRARGARDVATPGGGRGNPEADVASRAFGGGRARGGGGALMSDGWWWWDICRGGARAREARARAGGGEARGRACRRRGWEGLGLSARDAPRGGRGARARAT